MPHPLRVPGSSLREGDTWLDEAASRYVARVHRLGPGGALLLFDPDRGQEADAVVVSVEARRVRCSVGPPRPGSRLGVLPVHLVQCLGKGEKPDGVVRDATVLGARGVLLVESSRSVPKLRERADARRGRWREVAVQAARQSGRGDIPELRGPLPFAEALGAIDATIARRLVLSPDAELPLLAALEGVEVDAPGALLIGPEGGLSVDELARAEAAGFLRVSLGTLVLRTETAATAALGAWLAWREAAKLRGPSTR